MKDLTYKDIAPAYGIDGELDNEAYYKRLIYHDKILAFPQECKLWLNRTGKLYHIEKSNSELSWVLKINLKEEHYDDIEQPWYFRRLKGWTFEEALNDAISKYPDEKFHHHKAYDWHLKDPDDQAELDVWLRSLV